MSNSFEFLHNRLKQTPPGRWRSLKPRSVDGIHLIDIDGRRLLNFGSNDYLGFVMDGSEQAINANGSTASALVCGWSSDHQQLANTIAQWEATESAIVLPSGYAACCGAIATLPDAGDLILSDALNHASLIDGCRLSKASKHIYRHRDVEHVRMLLESHRRQHDQAWIVTDSIFSMDGDVAPLVNLCDIADEFDAHVIVDEAHASGVFGANGSGMCDELGVKNRVHIRIGTLSKAIGSQGGFVAGPQVVIDTLINRCRMLIYSTSLSMGSVRVATKNINRIQTTDQHRRKVREFSVQFRQAIGVPNAGEIESQVPIVPVVIGPDALTTETARDLSDAGFFVPAIRPPTVPEGTARLRVSLSAAHDSKHVAGIANQMIHPNRDLS